MHNELIYKCYLIYIAHVQDDLDIITRFLVLARDPIISRTDKPFKVQFSSYSCL